MFLYYFSIIFCFPLSPLSLSLSHNTAGTTLPTTHQNPPPIPQPQLTKKKKKNHSRKKPPHPQPPTTTTSAHHHQPQQKKKKKKKKTSTITDTNKPTSTSPPQTIPIQNQITNPPPKTKSQTHQNMPKSEPLYKPTTCKSEPKA